MVKRKYTNRRRCRKGGMFGSTHSGQYGPQPVHHPQNSMFSRMGSAMSGVGSAVGDRLRRGMNSMPHNPANYGRSAMGYGGKRGTRKGKKRGGTKKRKRRGGSKKRRKTGKK